MQMENSEASLIRVEEQLKESAKNQTAISGDLKELFGKLERESKSSTIISGELKSLVETSKYRWDTVSKRLDDGDTTFKDLSKDVNDIKSSIRTLKWVFGTLASIATILSGVIVVLQFLGK